MENTNNPQNNPINTGNNFGAPKNLPNSVAVLVLGICSIVGCFCYGIIGLVCGIIALVLSNKDLALYKANPSDFTLSSFNNLKAGRVCGIIGLCLSVLTILYFIIIFAFVGAAFSAMPWSHLH